MISTPHQISSGCQNKKNEVGGAFGTCGDEERYTEFWWGNLRKGAYLDDLIDGRAILKWIFKKLDGRARIRLIWLRIGTNVNDS